MNDPSTRDTPAVPLPRLHRRGFLEFAWKGLLGVTSALGLAGLARFLSFQPYPTPPTRFDLGLLDELDFSQAMIVEEAQAILILTGKELKAFSLVCPHLGCIVDLDKDHFACPCHGSQFELDGALKKGPAASPLRQLDVEVDENGHLILDTARSG